MISEFPQFPQSFSERCWHHSWRKRRKHIGCLRSNLWRRALQSGSTNSSASERGDAMGSSWIYDDPHFWNKLSYIYRIFIYTYCMEYFRIFTSGICNDHSWMTMITITCFFFCNPRHIPSNFEILFEHLSLGNIQSLLTIINEESIETSQY